MRPGRRLTSVDLSKPDRIRWLFDKYDPTSHRLATEPEKLSVSAKLILVMAPKEQLPATAIALFEFK